MRRIRKINNIFRGTLTKISFARWRSYFYFLQGVKSENGTALTETIKNYFERGNSELFKEFYNVVKMKKNKSGCRSYFCQRS